MLSNSLPSVEEIKKLHHKYAQSEEIFDKVYGHCEIVWEIAKQLIDKNNLDVDKNLVKVGCLLHDIGVYEHFDEHGSYRDDIQYIEHGIRGERILKTEGYSEFLQQFAANHTGVGFTKEDVVVNNLPMPAKDYMPLNQEQKLVMYADKFHSKTFPSTFNSFEWYKDFTKKFGATKPIEFQKLATEFGIPNLEPIAKKHNQLIRQLLERV